MAEMVKTTEGNGELHELIAVGTHVKTTNFHGRTLTGKVVERAWWFRDLMFYAVEEDGPPSWQQRETHLIYPGREPIEVLAD